MKRSSSVEKAVIVKRIKGKKRGQLAARWIDSITAAIETFTNGRPERPG